MGLEGKSVLVTRARGQNEELREMLERLGAQVVEVPTIEIRPPETWDGVDQAITRLSDYDWLIFTSVNAVDAFLDRVPETPSAKIAVVGTETARRIRQRGLTPDLVPRNLRAEGLIQSFPKELHGVRMLLPRAEVASEDLPRTLRERGAALDVVTVYRTGLPAIGGAELRSKLEGHQIDCVTLTSGSIVRNLIQMLDGSPALDLLSRPALAVIGPVTRQCVIEAGLWVEIEPKTATIRDLVEAIRTYFD